MFIVNILVYAKILNPIWFNKIYKQIVKLMLTVDHGRSYLTIGLGAWEAQAPFPQKFKITTEFSD